MNALANTGMKFGGHYHSTTTTTTSTTTVCSNGPDLAQGQDCSSSRNPYIDSFTPSQADFNNPMNSAQGGGTQLSSKAQMMMTFMSIMSQLMGGGFGELMNMLNPGSENSVAMQPGDQGQNPSAPFSSNSWQVQGQQQLQESQMRAAQMDQLRQMMQQDMQRINRPQSGLMADTPCSGSPMSSSLSMFLG